MKMSYVKFLGRFFFPFFRVHLYLSNIHPMKTGAKYTPLTLPMDRR